MKFFIGQAVTGEDLDKLRAELEGVYKVLEDKGHSSYDVLREDRSEFEKYNKGERMGHAFKEIDKCDVFLAIVRSGRRSEGMLMEIGYCLAKEKRIVLAIKKDVEDTYLREMTNEVIEFEDSGDFVLKLREARL